MKLAIHIGHPKCMSTSLQRSFFGKYRSVNYLGIAKDGALSYENSDLEFIFEILLKSAKEEFFDSVKSEYKRKFHQCFLEEKVNLISSEHLSLNFTFQGIDPIEKLRRLSYLCGGIKPTILFVYRENKESHLFSIYKELCKMGYYSSDFVAFGSYLERYIDRSFLSDLNLSSKLEQLSRFFPAVAPLKFEDAIGSPVEVVNDWFATAIGVKNEHVDFANDYKSVTDEDLARILLPENDKYRARYEEAFESHRSRTLFYYLGLQLTEGEIFAHVLKKRKLNGGARLND